MKSFFWGGGGGNLVRLLTERENYYRKAMSVILIAVLPQKFPH